MVWPPETLTGVAGSSRTPDEFPPERTAMTTTGTTATAARPGRAQHASAGRVPAHEVPSARSSATGGPVRSWAPVWVRPSGTVPLGFRRPVPAVPSVPAGGAGTPARLDEATRRLLRVPSLVAETASRLSQRHSGEEAVTPTRPSRRRARRPHSRRPPAGMLRVVPALGTAGGCDDVPGHSVAPAYRMSRRARLSLTLTVFAAVVVLTANALLSSGPTTTTEITVVAGDTLWSIAERAAPGDEVWSVIDEISALNGLTGTDLLPGQVLTVPVG